ncbi:NAD(P)/FAD-dependent oxidoreductase [Estrella lausannensis]|uniref:NADH dehydrogenase n=1 Tax=Estrella lausannensis TaxID=483423 RepID=A0A0H5DQ63_9BACT|nr:NAD(P)/FAD-dependent oxidoreductase [Estrella lausannensis]CRX37669.1 NADH dehydrogenase [Estrella lausannensis]
MSERKVLIVGGGFAGLEVAKTLSSSKDVEVTLLDKNNYHQFKPLLYQVATAALTPDDVATPFRTFFEKAENIHFKMEEVTSIDAETKTVHTKEGNTYQADTLVLATGASVNFLSVKGADEYALPLYTLDDAERLRAKIIETFEEADKSPGKDKTTDCVIVGAGPTGCETAGAIASLFNEFKAEFKDLPSQISRIYLVDHGKSPLKAFSEESQRYAQEKLSEMGVVLDMQKRVLEVTKDGVLLEDQTFIPSRLVIWAGGLQPNTFSLTGPKRLKIEVSADLSWPSNRDIYVLGDAALIRGEDGEELPSLASVAVQSGKVAGENILADCRGKERMRFFYHDKGIMAMIGKYAAVAEVGKKRHQLEGPIAFAAWLGVHAALLPSYRQRAEAILEWGWDYVKGSRPFQIADKI